MNKQLNLRLMHIVDIPELISLWRISGLSLKSYAREEHEVVQVLKQNGSSCFVAEINGKIVGAILGTFNGRRAWIYHLAVHPNWQKHGAGSRLIKKSETVLTELGATKIFLGIVLKNFKTVSFYEKNGYTVEADAILMTKDMWKGGEGI